MTGVRRVLEYRVQAGRDHVCELLPFRAGRDKPNSHLPMPWCALQSGQPRCRSVAQQTLLCICNSLFVKLAGTALRLFRGMVSQMMPSSLSEIRRIRSFIGCSKNVRWYRTSGVKPLNSSIAPRMLNSSTTNARPTIGDSAIGATALTGLPG